MSDVASAKHEAQDQILDVLQTWIIGVMKPALARGGSVICRIKPVWAGCYARGKGALEKPVHISGTVAPIVMSAI